MRKLVPIAALALVAFVAVSGLGLLYRPQSPEPVPANSALNDSGIDLRHAIEVFTSRVRQRPSDAVSLTVLGDLHQRNARETGDVNELVQAEKALESALGLVPENAGIHATLASVYLSNHRFDDALGMAESAYSLDSGVLQAVAVLGDARLAVGQYEQAERAYAELFQRDSGGPTLARLAQIDQLHGRSDEAEKRLRKAAQLEAEAGATGERLAWYFARLGDLAFDAGDYETSRRRYLEALEVFGGYHVGLAGLGQATAALGNHTEAIEFYEAAVAIVPDPTWLSALGDLHALTDRKAEAERYYNLVGAFGRRATDMDRRLYGRALSLFYADAGNPTEALRLAEVDLTQRADIFGYDVYAWALYGNGRLQEARAASDRALSLGIREAPFLYHAGMISAALGDTQRAISELTEALTLSPQFDPLQTIEARRTILALEG